MSWPERSVQFHRRQTDCAIHRAYAQLASDPATLETFSEILHSVRKRAPRLFEAPVFNGRHTGVDALVHLSRFKNAHVRPIADWQGTLSSWRVVVSSLAHHLLCKYRVPAFLASSWCGNGGYAERQRQWFVAHSRGASFRSLNLPMVMTRKMENIFLASPDHLRVEYAMRQAELLALGTPARFMYAILSTRLAWDLRHGEFWRTVWLFLIEHADEVDPAQISPMIDYLQAVRHERVTVETPDGNIQLDPSQPTFSMKGRTVHSMLRLMRDWHRTLGRSGPSYSWMRSPFRPLVVEEPSEDSSAQPRRWHMSELTNSAQLRGEGAALHHCVASYADRCCRGISSIWALRYWTGEKIHHVLTVEVSLTRRAVVQARGRKNRGASGKPLRLLRTWAIRERLRLNV